MCCCCFRLVESSAAAPSSSSPCRRGANDRENWLHNRAVARITDDTQPTAASTQQPNKRGNTDGFMDITHYIQQHAAAALTLMSFSHFQNCRSLLFLTLLLDICRNECSLDIYAIIKDAIHLYLFVSLAPYILIVLFLSNSIHISFFLFSFCFVEKKKRNDRWCRSYRLSGSVFHLRSI